MLAETVCDGCDAPAFTSEVARCPCAAPICASCSVELEDETVCAKCAAEVREDIASGRQRMRDLENMIVANWHFFGVWSFMHGGFVPVFGSPRPGGERWSAKPPNIPQLDTRQRAALVAEALEFKL